ncbi:MAG: beta-ketoacyl-[acyl-carrier-protein] synthase family protein [Blastochloris sp.]|nr:beta-ketoacyl-[acyl-carrier-protein] synthase family protein [Blastochloris sp.]
MASLTDSQRIVITGRGAISGYGIGVKALGEGLKEGRSAIRFQPHLQEALPCRIGSSLGEELVLPAGLKPLQTRSSAMALVAAHEAWQEAQMDHRFSTINGLRIHVSIGWGPYDFQEVSDFLLHDTPLGKDFQERTQCGYGEGVLRNFFQPSNGVFSHLAACAASTQAIGRAFHDLKHGRCDTCLVGGSDTRLHEAGILGYHKLGALATGFEAQAEQACRPFDLHRSGFVIGEGAGFIVMETLAQAQRRGVQPLAEILAATTTTDAYRLTDPDPEGLAASHCIKTCLAQARIAAQDLDYIQAHGTGTLANDRAEAVSLRHALGQESERILISSLKPYFGHCSMAAGALETVACVEMLQQNVVVNSLNLKTPEPSLDLNYARLGQERGELRTILKNSFGFGGQNACLLISKL